MKLAPLLASEGREETKKGEAQATTSFIFDSATRWSMLVIFGIALSRERRYITKSESKALLLARRHLIINMNYLHHKS